MHTFQFSRDVSLWACFFLELMNQSKLTISRILLLLIFYCAFKYSWQMIPYVRRIFIVDIHLISYVFFFMFRRLHKCIRKIFLILYCCCRLKQQIQCKYAVRISWAYWFRKALYYQVAFVYMLTRLITNVSQVRFFTVS